MMRFLVAVLIMLNVATAIGLVFVRYRHRELFVELTVLEKNRDELNIEFGQLQLEQATMADDARIEQIAHTRLGMKLPESGEVEVIWP
jgi:cell division protein FtsL